MKTATFSCPHCSSPLRIRDRAFVERKVGCPECGEPLEVSLDRNDDPVARKVISEKPARGRRPSSSKTSRQQALKKKSEPKAAKSRSERTSKKTHENAGSGSPSQSVKTPKSLGRKPLVTLGDKFSGMPEILLSPVGIAWVVAGLVALILLIMAWPGGDSVEPPGSRAVAADSESPETTGPKASAPKKTAEENDGPIPPPNPPKPGARPDDEAIVRRMTQLGEIIHQSVEERGHYPAATVDGGDQPVDDRFSWLADLYVRQGERNIPEPQWDQPWNDILNDRFVRQQREMFLNPAVGFRVGVDRYPATHFVGVAGVGEDAPRLPVDHPRTGIFGIDRRTRPNDIKDGAANTMMVAGVDVNLKSWAAGEYSLRAFTQEPYIGGPDGFGTGQKGGMSVLMADGSVRFLSKDTDPEIIRRLAAMNDGGGPEGSRPKERGDGPLAKLDHSKPLPAVVKRPLRSKTATAQTADPASAPAHDQPESDPPESADPPVDISAALSLKLVKFEQVKAVPFQDLLFQLEEMVGVPIRGGDGLPGEEAELWNQPVSLSLTDATVGEILKALLQKAELRYSVESDHIRLHKAE